VLVGADLTKVLRRPPLVIGSPRWVACGDVVHNRRRFCTGARPVLHMVVHRPELPLSGEHSLPAGYATISRCRRCGFVVGYGDQCDVCRERPRDAVDDPGEYRGRHHTEWVATVDELIIQGDDDEAELLLLRLISATEAETALAGVPPLEHHFKRLAQIARRRGDQRFEQQVAERYAACARLVSGAPGDAAASA
jgi:hypothetical protein